MSEHDNHDLAVTQPSIARDPTGLRQLSGALNVARLASYKVTVPGVADIIAALNDLIAGVEELQRQ